MRASEAQKRASKKWQDEKVDEVRFRVRKGEKAIIQSHAEKCGETLNAFLRRAVKQTIKQDVSSFQETLSNK